MVQSNGMVELEKFSLVRMFNNITIDSDAMSKKCENRNVYNYIKHYLRRFISSAANTARFKQLLSWKNQLEYYSNTTTEVL
jgi:hypothetical protein